MKVLATRTMRLASVFAVVNITNKYSTKYRYLNFLIIIKLSVRSLVFPFKP